MKLAAIQHDIAWQDPARTHALIEPMIAEAVDEGSSLVVLSEMFATGFTMDAAAIAQPPDGPSVEFLRNQAAQRHAWLAGSLAIVEDGRYWNRFFAAGPDGELVSYDKRHPFSYAGEDKVFARGDDFVTFTIDGLRITPFICYDLRFGDEFWSHGPETDLFVVVANWPEQRRMHWSTLLRARAIENQCYVVGTNRVGDADGLHYTGDTAIIDPFGHALAEASGEPAVLTADVTVEEVQRIRAQFPFLQDRR
ncbi:MAG: carbon-nitrogen family hydrolase [Actinobacteria bacterium]|nr:carbon-nitrogen family hydrolase [Actinomycetota bacterium]